MFALLPHPDTPPVAVKSVRAAVVASADGLRLNYLIDGAAALSLPPPASPDRADGLWKTTCFELFVQAGGTAGYLEFNFSPSSQWAAYRFAGYRAGMQDLPLKTAPQCVFSIEGGILTAAIELGLPPINFHAGSSLGLSAVIEEIGGTKSFWALAHAPGPPDFHNRDCFIATLPAPIAQ